MKNKLTILRLGLLMAFSCSAGANDIGTMIKQQMQADCNDAAFNQCLGQSRADCLAISEEIYQRCFADLDFSSDNAEQQFIAMEQCPQDILENKGINQQQVQECEASIAASDNGGVGDQEYMAEAEQAFSTALGFGQATGREQEITLPIYQPSELTIHLPDGGVIEGFQTNPAATFVVDAPAAEVLAFYQAALPGFVQLPGESVLVEKRLQGATYPWDYYQVQSISINPGRHPQTGKEVNILQISYKK